MGHTNGQHTGFQSLLALQCSPSPRKKSDDLKISSNVCFLNNTLMPAKFTTPTCEIIPKRLRSGCKSTNFKGTLICDFQKMPTIQVKYSCLETK